MGRGADSRSVLLVLLMVMVVGCSSTTVLPTVPSPIPGVLIACDDAGLEGTLAGDPTDPRLAWVISRTGVRVDITWPRGFVATFEPDLVIRSADHDLTLHAGDHVRFGGGGDQHGGFTVCEIDGQLFLPSPNPA